MLAPDCPIGFFLISEKKKNATWYLDLYTQTRPWSKTLLDLFILLLPGHCLLNIQYHLRLWQAAKVQLEATIRFRRKCDAIAVEQSQKKSTMDLPRVEPRTTRIACIFALTEAEHNGCELRLHALPN